jgi:hypothetical protein
MRGVNEDIVYDTMNERVVIGAAIAADTEKRRELMRSISADELLVPQHAAIWRSLKVFVDRNMEYDGDILRRFIRDEVPEFDDHIVDVLEASAELPTNLDWRVGTLRWDAARSRIAKGPLVDLVTKIRDPKAEPEHVAGAARSLLRALEGGYDRKYMRRPEELSRVYKADIAARRASGNFYPFGYSAMDARLTEGSMPRKLCTIVGLSASGKSTFSCDFAIRLARGGRKVLYCAWEMGSESTMDIMVSSMTRIELTRLVQGSITPEEQARVEKVTDFITTRIKFMDNAFFDPVHRRGKREFGERLNDRALDLLEGYIAESGCDVVVMDLWERCLWDLSYDGVTAALYRQQQMAKDLNFYGVIVHQLRLKDVETRKDKRPTRESIKGTGAFVEVVDQIFGVHRDAQFKAVPDDSIEVMCMKQRKGKSNWAVRFDWDPERALVSGGKEVPYDPGLESADQFGGEASDFNEIRSAKRGRRRT